MVHYDFSIINLSLALKQALSSHTATVFPDCPANIHFCFMDMKYYKTTAWDQNTEGIQVINLYSHNVPIIIRHMQERLFSFC
jgi:hypothetical protein